MHKTAPGNKIFSTLSLKKKSFLLLFTAFCLCLIFFTGCTSLSAYPSQITGFYFDTVVSVTIYDPGCEDLLPECMELAAYYEKLLSPYVEGSDIWNINHSRGSLVTVQEDTLHLLNKALDYARLSEGLVDPTIGSLSRLWNFGSGSRKEVPSSQDITQALTHVNYNTVVIKDHQVMLKDPDACLDLGFIAKGFIADQIRDFLLSRGVTSALINLGRNILVIGNKPDGTPFRIGIQKPFEKNGTTALTLDLSDASMVSSGSYEQYFEQEGKRYHHILSPFTGFPAESGLDQVTILSAASVDGDALSTLCFILGYEKSLSLLKNFPDIRAVFITEEGHILYANFD